MSDESKLPFVSLKARRYEIPDDLARELAAIVIEWGALENAITVSLEQLRVFKVVRDLSDTMPGAFGAKMKLWRRSYAVLFPTIKFYNDIADNIYTNARIVGLERHRIIHGLWRPDEGVPGTFSVLSGIDRRKDIAYFTPTIPYLAAVHADIRQLSDATWSLNASRQLHAFQGQFRLQHVSLAVHPAHQTPPSPEKP